MAKVQVEQTENPREAILEHTGPGHGPDAYQLWICKANKPECKAHQRMHKHCEHCRRPVLTDTVAAVIDKLMGGGA